MHFYFRMHGARILSYVDTLRDFLAEDGMRNGCLCGNIGAEANAHGEEVRRKIVDAFSADARDVAACLKAALAQKEVSDRIDVDDVAGFFVSSLQGAFLVAKVEQSPEPVNRFKRVFFSMILPPLGAG